MAVVRFPTAAQVALPDVCVKTGRLTAERVEVVAYYRPRGPAGLLPTGLLAALGAAPVARHTTVALPFSPEVAVRYRRWRTVVAAVLATGGAVVALGASTGTAALSIAGLATLAAGVVSWWANLAAHTCGVHVDAGATTVTLRRCHPRFRSAVEARAG